MERPKEAAGGREGVSVAGNSSKKETPFSRDKIQKSEGEKKRHIRQDILSWTDHHKWLRDNGRATSKVKKRERGENFYGQTEISLTR